MRVVSLVVGVCAACSSKMPDYPVGGGGTADASTHDAVIAPDAAKPDAATGKDAQTIDAALFFGRVCLAADPRNLTNCASTGAGGLTVRIGSNTAVTGPDGRFTIVADTGVWRVTGPNIISSFQPLTDYEIPAISTATFAKMLSDNAIDRILPGMGSMMVQVVSNGAGLAGAGGITAPSLPYDGFLYDGATPTAFTRNGTGNAGVIWAPGLDVGTSTMKVTVGQIQVSTPNEPIYDQGITFAIVTF